MSYIQKSAEHFREFLLPYFFVIRTSKEKIIIYPQINQFKHLVGGQHSEDPVVRTYKPEMFYDLSIKGQISDEQICTSHSGNIIIKDLRKEDRLFGCTILRNLIENCKQMVKYDNKYISGSLFRADYLVFEINEDFGLYLGLKKNNSRMSYAMCTVILDRMNRQRFIRNQKVFPIHCVEVHRKDIFEDYMRRNFQ